MRAWFLALPFFACSSTPPLPDCSAAIPAPTLTMKGAGPISDAAYCVSTGDNGGQPAIASAADLTVDGWRVIGPAVSVSQSGTLAHGIDVVVPLQGGQVGNGLDTQVAILVQRGAAPAHAGMVSNLVVEGGYGKAHLHISEAINGTAVFQAALPANPSTGTRHYTYRAISGVSMGGFGASVNFWQHPERYDAIAVLGADPGPDMTYTLGMVRDYFVAGFCTAADGPNMIGQLCAPTRPALTAQGEITQTFEKMHYEAGNGTGLTLKRSLYMRAMRDLSRAMGNVATYNGSSPYLPPGVASSVIAMTPADFCATPQVMTNFYDVRYNPNGTFPVITFCDGNDSSALGLGVFDPTIAATDPAQVLLAVDVNGNGKRDSGEPVIVQHEPFDDVGTDGLASANEPGYDPMTNPDPSGDDFHYLWNPTGTENNWRYDDGEPYQDVGVDGVPMATGGCQFGSGPNCWDYGEGNGKFDWTPGQDGWRAVDPRTNMEAASTDGLSRVDVYYDAGIRDFFNAEVSTNALLGVLTSRGAPVRAFDGFPALLGLARNAESMTDVTKVDVTKLSRNVFVRYGDPDLDEATVEATGDGRHAGAPSQVIKRAQMLFHWIDQRWPNGDRALATVDSDKSTIDAVLMQSNGRMTPYVIILPPGYFQPENASKTYPVVYLGHGYGMAPEDLATVAVIAQNLMVDPDVDEPKRLQKFIVVAIDAECRPGGDVSSAPLPTTGDLCEEGGFYVDHPEGTYLGSTMIQELDAYISANYRARPPADL